MGSDLEVTAADRAKAAQLSGCVLDDHPGAPFCASHDEDGNPPWHRCRWVPIAQALADERAKARAPFLDVLVELQSRVAGYNREPATTLSGARQEAYVTAVQMLARANEVSQT